MNSYATLLHQYVDAQHLHSPEVYTITDIVIIKT
jgi:hypothetical protein